MYRGKIEEACNLIRKSQKTMVLTGAGASTESGIPDFRSPGTGLWENTDPMEVLSTNVLHNDPETFYNEGFKILGELPPRCDSCNGVLKPHGGPCQPPAPASQTAANNQQGVYPDG